jgi:hypothetical protein
MGNPTITTNSAEAQLLEDLLLRTVVDSEFRNEYIKENDNPSLPSPVSPQDMTFTEIVRESVTTACRSTCISGFTLVCDGQSIPDDCKSTCISGYTVRCDGTTL